MDRGGFRQGLVLVIIAGLGATADKTVVTDQEEGVIDLQRGRGPESRENQDFYCRGSQ